jgi:hypothetical protein
MSINYIVVLNAKVPNKAYLMAGRNFEPYVFSNIEDATKEAKKVCNHFKIVAL